MPDVQTLLREYGDHLERLAPAIEVDELELEGALSPKSPTPLQRPWLVVVAAAAVVVLTIGGLAILFSGGPDDTISPSSTAPAPTTPETVPSTLVETTPEPTTPELFFPPPPRLGEPVGLHPDQELLAGVWIEAALNAGDRALMINMNDPAPGVFESSTEAGSLIVFPDVAAASEHMTNRIEEEGAPDEPEQPEPIDLGDEPRSFRASSPGGVANVHMIRVGRVVLEVRTFNEEVDFDEVASVVAAMESSFSPSVSAHYGPVQSVGELLPDEQPLSYMFTAWRLPVGDVEGGDVAEWSMGYGRDGQGTCETWTGDVEPIDYVTYTKAGDDIRVATHTYGDPTGATTVSPDDPEYLAAVAGCDRFPPLAEAWGLGDLVTTARPSFNREFEAYQTAVNEFVVVAPQEGYSESNQGTVDQLTQLVVPDDVSVSEPDIGVDGLGYVSIGVQLQGPRSSLEEMFGIDLSALPNGTIGMGFSFESGNPDEWSQLP